MTPPAFLSRTPQEIGPHADTKGYITFLSPNAIITFSSLERKTVGANIAPCYNDLDEIVSGASFLSVRHKKT